MSNRFTTFIAALRKSLIVKVFAGLILFYFLFAWLAINPLAKWLVPRVAETQLASKAKVGKVTFDPFRLTTTIEQFALSEKNDAPLLSFEKLVVDLESSGLFRWAWKFRNIELSAPQANIHISDKGRLNWADLIAKLNEDPSPPSKDLPRLIIENIDIRKGNIEYLDAHRPAPLHASLKPLDFQLDGFSTLPEDRGDYLIAAKLPYQGGTLKWKGDFGVNPLASKGHLAIEGLQVAKLMQWVNAQTLPVQAEAGTFTSELTYDFTMPEQHPQLLLTDARLTLKDFAGQLAQGDRVALHQLELLAKKLVLEQQPHLSINTHDIAVNLNQLTLHKPQADFSVATANLTLPALTFSQQDQAQVVFEDLNLALTRLRLQHQQHSLFQLPELSITQVGLNLAEKKAGIGKIVLADGQLSATHLADGTLDWQQALANPASPTPQPASEVSAEASKDDNPFQIQVGEIALTHWQLAYLDQQFARPLQAAIADFNLSLALDQHTDLQLNNIQAEAKQLSVQSGKKPMARMDAITLSDGHLALAAQKVSLGAIQLAGLKTSLIRQADQQLNWQKILTPANQPPQASQKHAADQAVNNQKPAWDVALKRLSLQGADIHIEDQSTSRPVSLDITGAQVEVANLSQHTDRMLPLKAGFKIKQGGQFKAQGKLAPAPFKADMQLSLANVALTPFAPYIKQVATLELQDGKASIQGKLQQSAKGATTFKGGFHVDQWSLIEEASQQPLMRWEKLQGDGLTVSLAPNKLQLDTLTLTRPQTKFIIYPDRSLNISKVVRSNTADQATGEPTTIQEAPANNAAATSDPASGFPVAIDTVRINAAELEFADLSLPQPFGTNIHTLGGVINGISSNAAAIAQVELDGKVDEYGAARIRGSLQPFKTTDFTDIRLAFTNLEMNRLTPYSGKFAGRKIESGKLSVDLEYKIKDRKLMGDNKFVIQKLSLGEKVDSKDAADLPLDLAIAILEDRNGVIDLDLPISGSLDDPKFSYGSILWKAFTNVLTKIVTAPFSALGKLFGSSEKLEAIVFEPGKAAITPPELEKLHALGAALDKRQQLKLGIVPGYDTAADTRAIQEMTLRRQVAEEMGIRLEKGQAAGPIDLHNPKVQSAIQVLHDRLTKKGLLKRLASKLEKAPEGFYEQAQETLTTSIQVTEAELQALANARADAIAKTLQESNVRPERFAVTTPASAKADGEHVPTRLTLEPMKP